MPLFEYRCSRCGDVSEFLEGVTQDKPTQRCRSCGSEALERLPSASVVRRANKLGPQTRKTCCGREERCDTPPCGGVGDCQR